ncbi:hypothetical protein Pcinc_002602 [Petrolisthes cinctipes]|uniref:Uncharacterized protein n=1 Tax=Petrolisthes cinctipes TaxID=88211 RepID=A0AAE1GKI6_PETCI|nr:hypothetical protein Pcinc_016553 [Petrolisthes cinctipes]KAK3893537.1 hypothetical protein Pcinc_002602 [Petrolisthes cinctipes]
MLAGGSVENQDPQPHDDTVPREEVNNGLVEGQTTLRDEVNRISSPTDVRFHENSSRGEELVVASRKSGCVLLESASLIGSKLRSSVEQVSETRSTGSNHHSGQPGGVVNQPRANS